MAFMEYLPDTADIQQTHKRALKKCYCRESISLPPTAHGRTCGRSTPRANERESDVPSLQCSARYRSDLHMQLSPTVDCRCSALFAGTERMVFGIGEDVCSPTGIEGYVVHDGSWNEFGDPGLLGHLASTWASVLVEMLRSVGVHVEHHHIHLHKHEKGTSRLAYAVRVAGHCIVVVSRRTCSKNVSLERPKYFPAIAAHLINACNGFTLQLYPAGCKLTVRSVAM